MDDRTDKADFWSTVQDAWIYDKLNSTDARATITPKHNTFQKVVEYFKTARYIIKKDGDALSMEIVHPKYITPSTLGCTGLIRKMDVVLTDDGLEARIRLNIPLMDDWILYARKKNGDGYKLNMLIYDGLRIRGNAA